MREGDRVGTWILGDFLGAGGTAEVYHARHIATGDEAVVKVIQADLPNEYHARFLRECRILESLDHPNIVRILEYGKEEGQPFYVMPRMDAVSLDRVIQATYRPESRGETSPGTSELFLSITAQLLQALEYAHGQGIFHRDIKPANVLVDTSGRAYLVDFGLARLSDATSITDEGQMVGTISYMSPEQVKGLKPSAPSDVYQMGILIHELFTGRLPFPELSNYRALMVRIQQGVPDPKTLNEHIPTGLAATIVRACASEPEQRYPEASELRKSIETVEPRTFELPVLPELPAEPMTLHRSAIHQPTSPALVISVVLLILIALGGALWYRAKPTPPDYLEQARKLRLSKNLSRAEVCYRLAIDSGQASIEAREELALVLLELSRPLEALETLGERESLDLLRDIPARVYLDAANAYRQRGSAAEARELLLRIPSASPHLPNALCTLAELELTQQRFEEAANLLSRHGLEGDETFRRTFLLAMALEGLGRKEEALESLARAVETTDNRVPVLEHTCRLLSELGKVDEALPVARDVATEAPSPERWYRVGRLCDRLPRPRKAIDAYVAALSIKRDHDASALALYQDCVGLDLDIESRLVALAVRQQSLPSAAKIVTFRNIVDLMNRDRSLMRRVAQALGQFVRRFPAFVPAVCLRASLRRRRQPAATLKLLQEARTRHPSFAKVYFLLAETARAAGQPERCLGLLEEGHTVAPDMMALNVALAREFNRTENHSKGVALLEKAIERQPQEPTYYIELGKILSRHGMFRRAIEVFLKLHRLEFKAPRPLFLPVSARDARVLLRPYVNQRRRAFRAKQTLAARYLEKLDALPSSTSPATTTTSVDTTPLETH